MAPPTRQHLAAYEVLPAMKREAEYFLSRSLGQVLVLAITGGMFITLGALFSLLLADGFEAPGAKLFMQGVGFSTGFFMIVLSRAALFTEANVILPASYLQSIPASRVAAALRFWGLAMIGNMIGAFVLGLVIAFAQSYPESVYAGLEAVVHKKMAYREQGGAAAWLAIVVSGMLGNGLIGMAAFLATMGNTLVGKYVPVLLVVTLFVAGNFQHSPANMGYFSLIMATGAGPGWTAAFTWNLLPAAIGNILGGAMLVALPFWYALGGSQREEARE